jgi:hypothetical protein
VVELSQFAYESPAAKRFIKHMKSLTVRYGGNDVKSQLAYTSQCVPPGAPWPMTMDRCPTFTTAGTLTY